MSYFTLILSVLVFPLLTIHASNHCNQSCPSFGPSPIQYPFGFSSGCEIQLNCTPNSGFAIGGFPIQSITQYSIRINLQSRCNRPVHTLRHLYSQNYAPTTRNAILLQNCTEGTPSSSCEIPNILVQARFDAPPNCSANSSLSCYTETRKDVPFLNFWSVERKNCKFLLSSLSPSSPSSPSPQLLNTSAPLMLEVEVVELEWWLEGTCGCDKNANCTTVVSPNGTEGYRCNCKEGFGGDGYVAGLGCRKVLIAGDTQLKLKLGLVGAASVIVVLVVVCCFFWKKRIQKHQIVEAFLRSYGPLQVQRHSYSEVKKMTNSFKEKLGQGGYGAVYKGKLKDGRLVAVKVLTKLKGDGEEFMNEVAAISRTSHVNVVTLLGFCFEGSKRALIYEFMSNGSLEKFIFDASTPNVGHDHLGWEALDRISLGIARGLEYLHRGCNTRILHLDIKPHNILLDENFTPKISDFGLAKICNSKDSIVSMLGARGTAGYIAPEVFSRNFGGVSHKSDVYSYGMMLSEMIGGRRNINVEAENTSEIYFPHWIYQRLELNKELGLQSVKNEEDKERARKMIIVSLWCIQTNPSNRPAMKEVIDMLEGSVDSLQIPPKPYLSSPPKSPADSSTTLVSIQ
ncbi:LEAF RUST 10 DISEASE-RESISTANCE LOCUS RECEPTOR-LIKE PROTEIN KINASE-like 2.1 isoform X6 [Malus sylvestris]|uniref:LEAF RUST 10 DISEASE-RESISTANCE LOCUS RECEPTOR-LIKE PROTEIN KINASE-like 2.1 isoform X6 n=1 Tax=Malus sylvestris TaxID=3752 RepID=UPI0021ACFBE7|nr:LEAF RUST 10 DISEASE-RESISTANCE LOCUS RECEPTOR-LIKE PROTEIN KINASE-like 2.1 isoform X6 [Malus sylvestris]